MRLFNRKSIKEIDYNGKRHLGRNSSLEGYSPSNNYNNDTVTSCVKIICETVAKPDLNIYKRLEDGSSIKYNVPRLKKILPPYFRPNKFMSSVDFFCLIETQRILQGNAIIYVQKKMNGEVELIPLNPSTVEIYVDDINLWDNGSIYYKYNDGSETMYFESKDIIHLKSTTSDNGIVGLSLYEIVGRSIENAHLAEEFYNGLYKNGLFGKTAVYYAGTLGDKGDIILKNLKNALTAKESQGLITVPKGMELKNFENNLVNTEFLKMLRESKIDILNILGIKSHQVNIYEQNTSYSSIEAITLDFILSTMLIIFKNYEQEFNYKLLTEKEIEEGLFFKFDFESLLMKDFKSNVEALSKAINNGIMTPNEVREKLFLTKQEEGNNLICNSNYIPLNHVEQRSLNTIQSGLEKQKNIGKEKENNE